MSKGYEAVLDIEAADDAQSQLEFQKASLLEGNMSQNNKSKGTPTTNKNNNDYGLTSQASELPQPVQTQQQSQQHDNKQYGFWQIEYYSKFFNVDTIDVANRIRVATIPITSFKDTINGNPDLYGPFWVSTTVIFFNFVTSCMAGSIDAYMKNGKAAYNFDLLSYGVGVFYGYVFAVPLILYLVGKYFKSSIALLDLINVYGYGCAVWLIIAAVCIVPNELVRWAAVGVGGLISTYHIARHTHVQKIMLIGSLLVQGVFVLALKIVFFNPTVITNPTSPSTGGNSPEPTKTG